MTLPAPLRDVASGAAPALLLALFSLRAGTFEGGAIAVWAAMGHAALIAFAAFGARAWRDPLRLGRGGTACLSALVVVIVVSNAVSPVPRAGWVGLLLIPAFWLLPAAAARCWSTPRRRTIGLGALAAVVAIVALWSLVAWGLGRGIRPALPLGHHNLLAAFLVILLPTLLPLLRRPGFQGAFGSVAGALAVTTVVATRSLAGAVALALVLVFALPRRRRVWALLPLAVLMLVQAPRLTRMVTGDDPSTEARRAYLLAGLDGVAARPWLGWGPGSTAWTLADHLPTRPGVLPAGQAVADLHNLPLQITYELGLVGATLLLATLFFFAWRQCQSNDGPTEATTNRVRRGAHRGLLAALVVSLGGLPSTVMALPVAIALLVGLAMATSTTAPASSRSRSRWTALPAYLVFAGVAFGLLHVDVGHWAYDRARRQPGIEGQRTALDRAVRADPHHPLYHARLAWIDNRADDAHQAARDAHGVAALWLTAGALGLDAQSPWADAALERACQLDPLGPMAPFLLALDRPQAAAAPARLARAWAAEPRLLAATALRQHPARTAALTALGGTDGIDLDWRAQFALRAEAMAGRSTNGATTGATLALSLDGNAATSLSLFTFRRAPWPADMVVISLGDPALLSDLGAAAGRRDTQPTVFDGDACTLGSVRFDPER